MVRRFGVVAVSAFAFAGAAEAAFMFTFDDPTGGKEISFAPSGATSGSIFYDQGALVDLVVSDDLGILAGPLDFQTQLFMDIDVTNIGPSADVPGGVTASISGFFEFRESGLRGLESPLLRGTFSDGSLLQVSTAGALITTSDTGSLVYEAFGALAAQLTGLGVTEFIAPSDAVFTLTAIEPLLQFNTTTLRGEFEGLPGFEANAAFTGTTNFIPGPGALATVALGGIFASRRRRR